MPSPRWLGLTPVMSAPSSRMRPAVGSTKPATICSVVVLPQPEGPSRQTNSPSAMERSHSATAGTPS